MVDASVALKWFLPESGNSGADNLLKAFLGGTVDLYAPDLLLIEAASGLWRRTVIRGELDPSEAKAIYQDLLTLPLNFQASERLRCIPGGGGTSALGVRCRLLCPVH